MSAPSCSKPGVAVDLHNALELGEVRERMLGHAVGAVEIDGPGGSVSSRAGRPGIDPQAAGFDGPGWDLGRQAASVRRTRARRGPLLQRLEPHQQAADPVH